MRKRNNKLRDSVTYPLALPLPQMPVESKTLEKLESDISDEQDDLMDPVNLRILVIPVKPSKGSHLHAVELGSLCQQLEYKEERMRSHPLDEQLPLTPAIITRYYLDLGLIQRRDAYLQTQGYSVDQWLAFRGLTRFEYQKLRSLVQPSWWRAGAELLLEGSLLSLVAGGGILGYFYGRGTHSWHLSAAVVGEGFAASGLFLKRTAAVNAIANSVALHWVQKKGRAEAREMQIITTSTVVSGLLFMGEVLLVNLSRDKAPQTRVDYAALKVGLLIFSRLALPFVQALALNVGSGLLQRFSLFSRNATLLKTYANRLPLEHQAEGREASRPWRLPCAIL